MKADKYYHTWLRYKNVMAKARHADKIYIPLRHPQDVMHSWRKRERLHDVDGVWRWYMAWWQLQAVYENFECDVICVDKQEDPRITDWSKVGHRDNEPTKDQVVARWDVLFQLPVVYDHYEL